MCEGLLTVKVEFQIGGIMLVRQANTQDLDAVCAVFASAFDRTAQWQWMIPDDDVRRPALNVLVRPLVQHALKVGQLDVAEVERDIVGALAWVPSNRRQSTSWRQVLTGPRLVRVLGGKRMRLFGDRGKQFSKAADSARPVDNHWYLSSLMVTPEAQGQGVGSALMEHGPEGAAYLECEEELVPYYERFGFEVVHRIEGEDIPLQIGMWRN